MAGNTLDDRSCADPRDVCTLLHRAAICAPSFPASPPSLRRRHPSSSRSSQSRWSRPSSQTLKIRCPSHTEQLPSFPCVSSGVDADARRAPPRGIGHNARSTAERDYTLALAQRTADAHRDVALAVATVLCSPRLGACSVPAVSAASSKCS